MWIKSEFDEGVEFNPDAHQYKIDGVVVRSVTTVLSVKYPIPIFLQRQESFQRDTKFGTNVHSITEQDDLGIERQPEEFPFEYQSADMWQEFVHDNDIEILRTEMILGSRSFMFAGTADRIIRMNGQNLLVDIKTSKIDTRAKLQLAGYAILCRENGIEIHGAAVASLRPPSINFKQINLASYLGRFMKLLSEADSGKHDSDAKFR
jgi:predicted RecB family nuclease